MRIQVITGNKEIENNEITTTSEYSRPKALDDFDVDVIDLSWLGIWKYRGLQVGPLDCSQDLDAISQMVSGARSAKIVYVFPRDGKYLFNYNAIAGKYNGTEQIRHMIVKETTKCHYLRAIPNDKIIHNLVYELTETLIGGSLFKSDFHFDNSRGGVVKTESERSGKITTVQHDNIFYTTLDICVSNDSLNRFIYEVVENVEDELPQWIRDYEFDDDREQKEIIEEAKARELEIQERVKTASVKLDENNRYKSILYNNGDKLVEVVFEILEKLFEYDLSSFIDEKKEDFLIQKEGNVFIGEIKGVTCNVKNEHISQLDVHYQTYIDEMPDGQVDKMIHALLIINDQRNKELSKREKIHEKQIKLAERNGSLIIETSTLLKLFELFLQKRLSSKECQELFSMKKGLLTIEDIEKETVES